MCNMSERPRPGLRSKGTYEDVLPAQIPDGKNRRGGHTSLIVGHGGCCARTHLGVSDAGKRERGTRLSGGRALRPIYMMVA